MKCPQCGAPLEANATKCKYCGEPITNSAANPQTGFAEKQTVIIQQVPQNNNGIDPSWPIKSKIAAGILAILLGGLGIHKFYLGKAGTGILYLIFCWTYIPAIIGFIEGIIYLTSNDHNFQVKNKVRLE